MRLRYNIKPCRAMCILEREREHIGLIWSRVTCLDSRLLLKVLHVKLLEILVVFGS
jgi:hypothetical protein